MTLKKERYFNPGKEMGSLKAFKLRKWKGKFPIGPPNVPAATLDNNGKSGQSGSIAGQPALCRLPMGFSAGGRRGGEVDNLRTD